MKMAVLAPMPSANVRTGSQREARRLDQLAQCVAKILKRILEQLIHCDFSPVPSAAALLVLRSFN